jgi:hypothetical protein
LAQQAFNNELPGDRVTRPEPGGPLRDAIEQGKAPRVGRKHTVHCCEYRRL